MPKSSTTPAGAIQVRLPDGLRQRLEAAADRRRVTLSEEIRARLQMSLVGSLDWKSRQLVQAFAILVSQLQRWHSSAHSFALLRVGLDELLSYVKPEDEPGSPVNERDGARIAGLALGMTGLGQGEEWGREELPQDRDPER